jgi:hypothetical protein
LDGYGTGPADSLVEVPFNRLCTQDQANFSADYQQWFDGVNSGRIAPPSTDSPTNGVTLPSPAITPSTAVTTTTVDPCVPTNIRVTMSVGSVQQQPYGNGETITLSGTFGNSSGGALSFWGIDASVVYTDGSTYDPGMSGLIGTGSQQNEQGGTVTVPPNGSAPWSGSVSTAPGQSARTVTLKQVALQPCGTISLTRPVTASVPG